MKKIILSAFAVCTLLFTACSSDDSGDDNGQECETCTINLLGEDVSTEICDNEDGTVTISTEGEEDQTTDLMGLSFAQFIATFETGGFECNQS